MASGLHPAAKFAEPHGRWYARAVAKHDVTVMARDTVQFYNLDWLRSPLPSALGHRVQVS